MRLQLVLLIGEKLVISKLTRKLSTPFIFLSSYYRLLSQNPLFEMRSALRDGVGLGLQ